MAEFEKRDLEALREYHSLFLILGIVMAVFGAILIIFPLVGTFAIDLLLGIALFVTGIVGMVAGSNSRKWKGSNFIILNGIIAFIFGALLLFYPLFGVITLTLLMGILLVVQGFFEIAKSFQLRHKFWKRMIFIDGIFGLILGILVLIGWPSDSLWVIGFIVGLSLFVSGIILLGLSSAIKKSIKK